MYITSIAVFSDLYFTPYLSVMVLIACLLCPIKKQFRNRRICIGQQVRPDNGQWFAAAFRASPHPMAISTPDDRYLMVNNSFVSLTGFSQAELIGHTPAELGIWPDADVAALISHAIGRQKAWRDYETPLRTKSGQKKTVLLCMEPMSIQAKRCVLTMMTDITQSKLLDQELHRLNRLNLVGQMAAGVAHEIRNPMTTVRGFLQFFDSKKEFSQYHDHIEMMIQELDRADNLIKEYIAPTRRKTAAFQPGNLDLILTAIAPLIRASALLQNTDLTINPGHTADIMMDEGEIRQLILNLARNGLDSMSSKGVLSISTYTESGDVILAVTDQGSGMDQQVLAQLGTPFFTTKEKGTGLGLPVCYQIAERHKAAIAVKTGPRGTTFTVRFKPT